MTISFRFKIFNELTRNELYEILALRAEVFVVEQHCFYLDPDRKDFEALHLLGIENDKLVAYMRLFLPGDDHNPIIFWRVLTSSVVRGKGYGKRLIQAMLDYCSDQFKYYNIHCSAQYYLKSFYESFGFKTVGDIYDDAGIAHIKMIKSYTDCRMLG